jgi:DNA invertase Pin-like site-specific DNA recombinase
MCRGDAQPDQEQLGPPWKGGSFEREIRSPPGNRPVMDGINTCTPAGRFTFHVVAAVAELERELIREITRAGIAAARRKGAHVGRPRAKIDLILAKALMASGQSFRQAARILGIGTATLFRALRSRENIDVSKASEDEGFYVPENTVVAA